MESIYPGKGEETEGTAYHGKGRRLRKGKGCLIDGKGFGEGEEKEKWREGTLGRTKRRTASCGSRYFVNSGWRHYFEVVCPQPN